MITDDELAELHPKLPIKAPFATHVGVRLIEMTKDYAVGELTVEQHHLNRNGVIHGGAIMAFADSIGGSFTRALIRTEDSTTTMDSQTRFLRSAQLGDVLRAEARPIHTGRRTVIVQTTITRSDGKVSAIVTQSQMTLSAEG